MYIRYKWTVSGPTVVQLDSKSPGTDKNKRYGTIIEKITDSVAKPCLL